MLVDNDLQKPRLLRWRREADQEKGRKAPQVVWLSEADLHDDNDNPLHAIMPTSYAVPH